MSTATTSVMLFCEASQGGFKKPQRAKAKPLGLEATRLA